MIIVSLINYLPHSRAKAEMSVNIMTPNTYNLQKYLWVLQALFLKMNGGFWGNTAVGLPAVKFLIMTLQHSITRCAFVPFVIRAKPMMEMENKEETQVLLFCKAGSQVFF